MKRATRMVFLGAVLTVAMAVPAAAQDVSVGYQFQRLTSDPRLNLPAGFNVDATFPLGDSGLRVMGQVDWSRKSESERIGSTAFEERTTLTAFGGGVRWSRMTGGNAAPFVQGLFGAMRASFSCTVEGVDLCDEPSETDAMLQVGGGIAVGLTPTIAFVGQVDYRRIFSEGEDSNTFRIVGGIRLSLSK